MTSPRPRRTLDAAGKARLIASLQAVAPALAPDADPEPGKRTPVAADFASHPLYRQTRTQLGTLEAFSIANPFLRPHTARAGAQTEIAGTTCLNFASYDYLGLNADPRVAAAAKDAIESFGTSVSASRVVAGERPLHRDLEAALAAHYRTEDAVVFVSGHATNVSTIATLMGPEDLVVYDTLSHNSIVVGAELSGAARRAVPHGDCDVLDAMLSESRTRFRNVLIAVEGLYSMDGDTPDLKRLIAIKRRHGAWLMVDEAHALGVLGAGGAGSAEMAGIDPADVDIWMGTLSKTLASCGGYIAGSHALVTILKHHAAGFVFSVGLAPPLAAAATTALEILHAEPERVARLATNGRHFLAAARAAGLDTGLGAGRAIMPVMVGDSLKAVALSERLLQRGINALPIVFPAVPMQAARLRFFLSAQHTAEDIDRAVAAVRTERDALDAAGFGFDTLLGQLAAGNPE